MICKKIIGCFDPSTKNSYSVRVYIIAVHILIKVESLHPACVSGTMHKMVDWGLELCLKIVLRETF